MFVFAFFTPAATPSVLLAGPTPGRNLGARSKTAPASPLCLFATVTVLAFAGLLNALRARPAVSPICEASSKRQGDGQRFQKKAMKTTKPKLEASAPANVRPSSVSKTRTEQQPEFVRHESFFSTGTVSESASKGTVRLPEILTAYPK